jgi:hypothetical protein
MSMKIFRQPLILALALAALSALRLAAQPSLDPPPHVELQEMAVVGSDLAATFTWYSDGAAPPPGAQLKLLDPQGLDAGSVNVIPVYGTQTAWIPGGATPRVGESGSGTLSRHFEMILQPTHEIALENELSVNPYGPVEILGPATLPVYSYGRQCYLHVVSLTCDDSEDNNGDEPYLVIQGLGAWRGPNNVRGKTPAAMMSINQLYLLCDSCQGISKTTTLDLWDLDDPGFPLFDPDDHLGSERVAGCSTIPLKTVKLSGSNYTYWLKYRVACFQDAC